MKKKQPGYSIRIDQVDQTLTRVQPQADGVWSIEELVAAQGGTNPPQNLIQEMARHSESVTWLMPNDLAQGSIIKLPPLKGKELARAVTGWVARQEELQPDDFFISWKQLPTQSVKGEEPANLVFALHGEQSDITEQMNHPAAMDAKPSRLLPAFMVLDQFYRLTQNDLPSDKAWNLIFLGRHENFQVAATAQSPLLTRGLPFDIAEDGHDDQYIDQLATEVDRSGFYIRQGESGKSIGKIIVAGDPQLVPRLVKCLKERSEIPCESWDISQHFQWGDREVPSEFFIPLMAAALGHSKPEYNLLPAPKRTLFGPKTRRRALVAAGSFSAALLPVLLIGSTLTAKVQEGYLKKAKDRLEFARVDAESAAEVYKRHRLLASRRNYLDSFHTQRPDLEEVLVQISNMAPAEVVLRTMNIKEDDLGKVRLTLTGRSEAPTSAQAQAAFIQFQKHLDDSPFLATFTEPLKLEISGDELSRGENPRTVFKLKYLLTAKGTEGSQEG